MVYEGRAGASEGRVFERKKVLLTFFCTNVSSVTHLVVKRKRFLQEEEESESSKTIFRGQK